MVVQKLVFS